jgi:hypothetical protein
MRMLAPFLVFALALPCPSRASGNPDLLERQTLEAAILLVGPRIANLPLELAPVAPDGASHGIEGWTTFRADGQGERIAVYTGSEIFRCARWAQRNPESRECVLRLASVIVHEAWHFGNGREEAGAYGAQMLFLMANHASDAQIASVQMARDRVVAVARKAAKAAGTSDSRPR